MADVKVIMHNPGMTVSRLKNLFYDRALPAVAEQELSDCNTYVRMQDGTLANSARIESGGYQITWNTPYAKKVYYTGTPRRNVNPNASLRWCEVAKRKHAKNWAALATRLLRGG